MFDGKLQVRVNDDVPAGLRSCLLAPKLYVGVCARTDPPGGEIKFTKMRIRKLAEMPGE